MASRWARGVVTVAVFLGSIALALLVVEGILRAVIGVDPEQLAEQRRMIFGEDREEDV